MQLKIMEKITGAMKEIAPVIEKAGFVITGISDNSNSSWDHLAINILPKPEAGSSREKILRGEGF